jgi:hypothetical protein
MCPSSSLNWAVLTIARLLQTGRPDEARPIAELLEAAPAVDLRVRRRDCERAG